MTRKAKTKKKTAAQERAAILDELKNLNVGIAIVVESLKEMAEQTVVTDQRLATAEYVLNRETDADMDAAYQHVFDSAMFDQDPAKLSRISVRWFNA